MEFKELPIARELKPDFFIEVLEVAHCFFDSLLRNPRALIHSQSHSGVFVHMRHENGLRTERLVVETSAAIAVPAGAYFKIERTVNLIFFSAIDSR
jgi:hypothetical protein